MSLSSRKFALQSKMASVVVAATFGMTSVMAQDLVSGAGVSVTAQDMEQDILRVPPELRAKTFSDPKAVETNASNMYVRRMLATEAVRAGLDQEPQVKAALAMTRERILSDARLAKVDQANLPTPEALEAYAQSTYKANPKRFDMPEEVRVRHILLRSTDPEARAKTEALLKEIKAGANFEDLAKTRSQDPGTAAKGGDLGLLARGRMVKSFEDAAFKLNQHGELSEVIETQFGFHILKLEEKKPAGIRSFEEVKDILIKEARSKLVNDSRLAEQDRILSGATFDAAAIEAFAKKLAQ